jgi:DNA-binding XRE family transcriptional regulator
VERERTVARDDALTVHPLVVLSQTFPARPSSFPEIREFVRRNLADSPLNPEDTRALQQAISDALLDAASAQGAYIQVSFRIFPDSVEVDVLRAPVTAEDLRLREEPRQPSFADWMAAVLKREHLSQEAAARQLGVSVKTVSRWVSGETEPRLRDLRRIRELFGEVPIA